MAHAKSAHGSFYGVATCVCTFPSNEEEERMQALMEQYQDTPMDFADASLVAAAETLRRRENLDD